MIREDTHMDEDDAGPDIRGDQEAAICEACTKGDEAAVRRLLAREPTLVGAFGPVGEDHREFMRQFGADGGWTPLHLACHYGQTAIVRLLLDAGANPNVLSRNMIGNRPLGAAVAGGQAEVVKLLLSGGADVNAADVGGLTALHLAENDKRHEIVAILLAGGADRSARDKKGRTPADLRGEPDDQNGTT